MTLIVGDFAILEDGRIVNLRPLDTGYLPKVIDPTYPERGWKPYKGSVNSAMKARPLSPEKVNSMIAKGEDKTPDNEDA